MENNKLNKKLIVEKPMPVEKKKKTGLPLLLFILLLCAVIALFVLEKLNYTDYLNFI